MKISDYYTYAPKSKIKAGDANPNGKYQFYTSSPDESRRCDEYLYDCKATVMGTGGSATLHYYDGKFSTSTDCLTLIPNEKIRAKYLYYFFLANMDVLEAGFKGAGLKHTSKGYIDNIEITKIPSLPSQDKIVNLFDELALRIEKERRQIEKLDELVKARFVEMFGNYTMEKTIGEVATICRGASPRPISKFITKSNGENWIKIGDAKEDDIYITKTKELVTEDGANRSRRIKPGDFILSNSMSFGRPYISKIYGCVHDGWLIVSDYEQSFLPLFFYYAIRSELVQAQFRKSVAGAVVKNLNSDLVRSVKIVIPSIESQEKFSSFAKQIDKSKFVLSNELTMCDFYIRLIHNRVMHSRINLRVAQ